MSKKRSQRQQAYSVRIETPNESTAFPVTLMTAKQVEEVQVEFKKLAQGTGVKGARINVQRVGADDYHKVLQQARTQLRSAKARAA